ncbi:MAG TPA: hypothetical protein VLD37_05880 [Candidatus Bilamarchaeum sp.]|nr:hypothetical protein [Candidatus Bilamarchaeum sp.]
MNTKSRKGSAEATLVSGAKPFAGRSVLADALRQRDIKAEVEEEFRSVASTEIPIAFPKDSIRVESELSDAFGMRLHVFEPPRESLSQSQIDRMSADVRKAMAKAKKAAPAKEAPQEKVAPLSQQVLEEFASQALKVRVPLADSPDARVEASNIAGTCLSVRSYSRSKKKDREELDRE